MKEENNKKKVKFLIDSVFIKKIGEYEVFFLFGVLYLNELVMLIF